MRSNEAWRRSTRTDKRRKKATIQDVSPECASRIEPAGSPWFLVWITRTSVKELRSALRGLPSFLFRIMLKLTSEFYGYNDSFFYDSIDPLPVLRQCELGTSV